MTERAAVAPTSPVGVADAAPIDAAIDRAIDKAIDASIAPIVDESTPASLSFDSKAGRSLMGHTRASWPLDLPEMPWIANTFVNMSLDSFDGSTVVGSVEMYAMRTPRPACSSPARR
jgi:hypothetical protein